jgi:hypothetical protein
MSKRNLFVKTSISLTISANPEQELKSSAPVHGFDLLIQVATWQQCDVSETAFGKTQATKHNLL